jgi:predicted hotdog family 3-hydroxylacyl-ACP dehydratase
MLITRDGIRGLIPHAGSMCLIDAVLDWDGDSIRCASASHRDALHPLARHARLAAVHAIEYGAQAAAIHGGLVARALGRQAPVCYLGAVRAADLHAARLDDLTERLTITADLLLGDGASAVYQTRIHAGGRLLANARLTMVARPDAG